MSTNEILSTTFNKVSERHNIIKTIAEKRFLTEHSFIEVHCIEVIEKMGDANVTKLSKTFKMTKGAISKIIKKLIEKGAVGTYQKPENKKEIYYKLTKLGMSIYLEHEEMHKSRIERDSILFSKLSEYEKNSFINILSKVYEQLAVELKNMGMEDYI
jgi:DNA-binding MarR family transcriptional regulator